MTAELTQDLYGAQIAYNYRDVPWHKEGTPIQDDITVVQAVLAARADDPIRLAQPAGLYVPDTMQMYTPELIDQTERGLSVIRITASGRIKVLGSASERFYIIQNIDLAELVEPLRQFGRVETVGSLSDGARFFITFLGDAWNVKGDKIQMYLAVRNTHLPGAALEIMLVCVRIVCRNTWSAAEGTAVWKLPLAHTSELPMFVKWVVKVLEEIPAKQQEIQEETRLLMDTPISTPSVRKLYDAALVTPAKQKIRKAIDDITSDNGDLPLPLRAMTMQIQDVVAKKDDAHRLAKTRIEAVKAAAFNNYQTSETAGQMGTMWRAFNAFTEAVDWNVRQPKAGREPVQMPKTASSNWWGERAQWKTSLYTTMLDYIKEPDKVLDHA